MAKKETFYVGIFERKCFEKGSQILKQIFLEIECIIRQASIIVIHSNIPTMIWTDLLIHNYLRKDFANFRLFLKWESPLNLCPYLYFIIIICYI